MSNPLINVGSYRHTGTYILSGGIASAVTAGAATATRTKDVKTISKMAVKRGLQGAIATGAAVEIANILSNPSRSNLNALGILALGFTGVYMTEKGIKDESEPESK